MQGNALVIACLNECSAAILALHQSAHLQEHWYETKGWAFSDWFDKIETESHNKCLHHVWSRINQLGGKILPAWAWTPAYEEEIGPAMQAMLKGLQDVHGAYNKACEAAEADDDYVTEKMIWKHLKWVEERMTKFEARIGQLEKVGQKAFLAEYL